ncbi:MAG: hypothetical protein ACOY4D_05435 [Pseudomonadota bacterium]
MIRATGYLALTLLALAAGGCAGPAAVQHIGDGDAPIRTGAAGTQNPEAAFAQRIAASALAGALDTTIGNWRMRGIYTGEENGCRTVAVTNLDLNRTTNYRVCGSQVAPIADVTPVFPTDAAAQSVRDSVTRAAWVNGRAANAWQDYRIEARVIGPARANGCAQVQTTVTWGGMLVEQKTDRVCD